MIEIIVETTAQITYTTAGFHELYHHLVDVKGIEMPRRKEERMANLFVREVMKKSLERLGEFIFSSVLLLAFLVQLLSYRINRS
jgi:hypothetical protein